jgi:thymidylate kinase
VTSTLYRSVGDGTVSKGALQAWLAVPALNAIFRRFDEAGVTYCLLRDPPEDISRKSDLDLLVAGRDFGRVSRILAEGGFARVYRGPGTHVIFVGYDEPGDRWVRLDVVTNLAFGSQRALRTYMEMDCLARRTRDGQIPRLSLEDEFWAVLLHFLLDKGAVASRHQARLQELAEVAPLNGDWNRLVEQLCPPPWSPGRIVECINGGEWAQLEGLAGVLSEAWERQQFLGVKWRTMKNRLARRAEDLVNIVRRPGVSVALLGPDGAGKSTLATEIAKNSYVHARTIYLGLKRGRTRRRYAVPGMTLAANVLHRWRGCLPGVAYRRRGSVIIFDRYSYDALAQREPKTWRRKLARWLMAFSCPAPDVTILLDAPPEILYERRGNRDLASTGERRARYLRLASDLPRITVMDTSRDPEGVRRQVTSLIWQSYVRHRQR